MMQTRFSWDTISSMSSEWEKRQKLVDHTFLNDLKSVVDLVHKSRQRNLSIHCTPAQYEYYRKQLQLMARFPHYYDSLDSGLSYEGVDLIVDRSVEGFTIMVSSANG